MTTYLVKTFKGFQVTDEPFADLEAAQAKYCELERAYYEQRSDLDSAYLYAVTGEKRTMLREFDRAYDEYLERASADRYKCVYCGNTSDSDDTVGFYCYAGPRGEHHYVEMIGGDDE